MERFAELPVSVFDPGFTLNPYDYLKDLYPREDVLGFQSEGRHFLFRHDDCNAVLKSHACRREPPSNDASLEFEARYASLFPNRAWVMVNNFNFGHEDLKTKVQVMHFIAGLAEQADFSKAEPVFRKLGQGADLENYVDEIATLPLRLILETASIPYTEEQLTQIYEAGCDFLRSYDNAQDEATVAKSEQASIFLREYVDGFYDAIKPGTLIYDYVQGCKANGLSDDLMKGNIIGPLLISASNTMGISSAFLLRNLVRYPEARKTLKNDPKLLDNDNTIIELLRRDNHVKALTRQAYETVPIGEFEITQGETIYLFFPGANLDPARWASPLELDFNRDFSQPHTIFGGAKHVCIGKALSMVFLRHMAKGFIGNLPENAVINDKDIEMDGDWTAERIIMRMPIQLRS